MTMERADRDARWHITVLAQDVEENLKMGWMVVLPSRPHPVGDAYNRVPMVWLCCCGRHPVVARVW